jgi:Bacterial inner membrane protein
MTILTSIANTIGTLEPSTVAGALAVSVNCTWPLQRSRRLILSLQVAGSLLFAVHYLLLGATTAAAMCGAGIVQGASAILARRCAVRLSLFGATILGGLAATIASWSGLPSLCAQTGQLLSATGRLQRSPQTIRWCFLASEMFWTTHNLLVGSRWGLTSDTLAFATLLIGLWRGRTRRSPQKATLHGVVAQRPQTA